MGCFFDRSDIVALKMWSDYVGHCFFMQFFVGLVIACCLVDFSFQGLFSVAVRSQGGFVLKELFLRCNLELRVVRSLGAL